jgi:hypothetical protein
MEQCLPSFVGLNQGAFIVWFFCCLGTGDNSFDPRLATVTKAVTTIDMIEASEANGSPKILNFLIFF